MQSVHSGMLPVIQVTSAACNNKWMYQFQSSYYRGGYGKGRYQKDLECEKILCFQIVKVRFSLIMYFKIGGGGQEILKGLLFLIANVS